jgi:hypothetical protein
MNNENAKDIDWSVKENDTLKEVSASLNKEDIRDEVNRDVNRELNELAIKEAEKLREEEDIEVLKGGRYHLNQAIDAGELPAQTTFKNETKWPESLPRPNYKHRKDTDRVLAEDEAFSDQRNPIQQLESDTSSMHDIMSKWDCMLKKEVEEKEVSEIETKAQLLAEEKLKKKQDVSFKGLLVFHINVGNLPSEKAEDYIATVKKQIPSNRVPDEWGIMWLPCREGASRMEQVLF